MLQVVAPPEDQLTVQAIAQMSVGERLLLTLPVCLLIPMCEELLFRGILLEVATPWVALPLSSLLFALAHGLNLYAFGLFVFGFALGLLTLRTRSLLPAMVAHGVFNAISLIFA